MSVVVVRRQVTKVVVRPTPPPRVVVRRPGPPGVDGIDGAEGLSAYEVAVANGFVGTEQEWLESLKGEAGAAGLSGGSATLYQGIASKDWGPWTHNLGYRPAGLQAFDQMGRPWEGWPEHHDDNSLTYHFDVLLAGRLEAS